MLRAMEFAWLVLLTIGLLFEGGEAQIKPSMADDLIQPAAKWLLDHRKEWGLDTPRALLAIQRSSTLFDRHSLENQLLTQQFDIELLLTLLKIQKQQQQQQQRQRRNTNQKHDSKLYDEDSRYSHSKDKKTDSSGTGSNWKQRNEHRQDKTDRPEWNRRNNDEQEKYYKHSQDESGNSGTEWNGSKDTEGPTGSMTSPAHEQANALSRFALTLAAMCRNPRDFYENDIIGPIMSLEDEEGWPVQPFTYAFHSLAVCAGGGHVKRRRVIRLLEFINQSRTQTHDIDVLAMIAMTISCLSESSAKYRHLRDYLEDPLKTIASQQEEDGSFHHNPATTALAVQALEMTERINSNMSKPIQLIWRPDDALEWFRNLQKADGSFGDLFITSEVLIALSGPLKSYAAVSLERCADAENLSTTTPSSIPSTTTISSAALSTGNQTEMVQFTYVVWIGQERSEVYAIKLTVPANTSFFESMKVAAEADPHFQFSSSIWPNGHFVHTINGHRAQDIGFHFWLLFRIRFMPDPLNPPPPTPEFVAPGGVDDMFPVNGDYFLFWYKNV